MMIGLVSHLYRLKELHSILESNSKIRWTILDIVFRWNKWRSVANTKHKTQFEYHTMFETFWVYLVVDLLKYNAAAYTECRSKNLWYKSDLGVEDEWFIQVENQKLAVGKNKTDEKTITRTMLKIDGECAICLESYQVGDVMAYSVYTCKRRIQHDKTKGDSIETILGSINGSGCHHVYHKTCLVVQYLANRNISQKGLKDGRTSRYSPVSNLTGSLYRTPIYRWRKYWPKKNQCELHHRKHWDTTWCGYQWRRWWFRTRNECPRVDPFFGAMIKRNAESNR